MATNLPNLAKYTNRDRVLLPWIIKDWPNKASCKRQEYGIPCKTKLIAISNFTDIFHFLPQSGDRYLRENTISGTLPDQATKEQFYECKVNRTATNWNYEAAETR